MLFSLRFVAYQYASNGTQTLKRFRTYQGPFTEILLDGEHLFARREGEAIGIWIASHRHTDRSTNFRKWVMKADKTEFTSWRTVPYVPRERKKPIKRQTVIVRSK